jgi:hypothetical protein
VSIGNVLRRRSCPNNAAGNAFRAFRERIEIELRAIVVWVFPVQECVIPARHMA